MKQKQLTVRQARRQRGWTQEYLAARAGMRQGTLSKLESGTADPRVSTVHALELALGIPRGTLVFSVPRQRQRDAVSA